MDRRRFKSCEFEITGSGPLLLPFCLWAKKFRPKLAANLADNCRELNQSFNKTMYISKLTKIGGGFIDITL